jgi:hypothetical protein
MDKHQPDAQAGRPSSYLNLVNIMLSDHNQSQTIAAKNVDAQAQRAQQDGSIPQASSKDSSIGDAWLDENGTINVRLRRTTDGINISGAVKYPIGDKNYDQVMKHLGGLKPGETKLVPPWKD